jgi:predicted PurR-regulated permease PerM
MKEVYHKYGSIILVILVLFLSYLIVKPFILPIISAAVIAYVFHPVHNFILRKLKRKNISALVMCLLVFLIVIIPFTYMLNSLLNELPAVYGFVSSALQNSKILHDLIYEKVAADFGINLDIGQILQSLLGTAVEYIETLLTSVPRKIISTSIAAFFLFFFFKDGYEILNKITQYLPFNKIDSLIIIRELKKMADAVLYGQLITALVQAILASLAYFILGVNAPLFWGLVTFIFAIIPMIGPSITYIPLSLSMVISSFETAATFGVVKGIILLLYGLLIISSVDNIIKPLLISDKVRMHPALVLVGVLGGLGVFGIIGIILGPLILVLLITIFNIYEMKEQLTEHIEHPHSEEQESNHKI